MARIALGCWVLLTTAAAIHVSATYALQGKPGLRAIVQEGPHSDLILTMLSVALIWGLAGATLVLLATRPFTKLDALILSCVLMLGFLYVNVMRERTAYGDVWDYVTAAASLTAGEPLPFRYLYPPLWASLLTLFLPLGETNVVYLLWFVNLLSLLLFFILLQAVLRQFGFSAPLAVAVVFLFGVANVPVLRTLAYVQVNFHVINLVLLALLLYSTTRLGSAVALGLAVHLKVSPLVLILAFVLARDYRWLVASAASLAVIALIPAGAFGWSSYAHFVNNVVAIHDVNPVQYREASIDSFFRALAVVTTVDVLPVAAWIGKASLLAGCAAVGLAHVRHATFVKRPGPYGTVLNAAPALLVLMVTASPLVWEHHPVMLAPAFLVILKCLRTPEEWTLYGAAYYLEFLMPTFDLFPWSYGRLVAPLLWLYVAWSVRARGASALFESISAGAGRWFAAMPPQASPG